ncbi:MAG: prolipoprotein diacylglyceryl transferase [Bacteroidales bacterium]|nr:prolipoprotein diacylglyceryl transferase [Bacteroidales bacterium]
MIAEYITWDVNPALIDSFITIRWYGLMFAIGFWLGFNVVAKMYKREGAPESWMSILLIYVGVATIVGARLGHVFFYQWDYYSAHPWKILATWEGGLASHGGAIGIIIAVILYSIFTTKRNPLWTFDRLTVAIALVGCLIRIGNLMNSEIFGHATTLPWGFKFVRSAEWHAMYEGVACHPTQIYEALCYLALFGLMMYMYWRRNAGERPGLLFGTFLVGTFGTRFLIEFIKNDQVAFEATMKYNMGQLLSIPFVLLGVFLIIWALTHKRIKIAYPNKFAPEPDKKKVK